jgi:hypothetical protein
MGDDIVTHGSTQVVKNFEAWLRNTLPQHYNWYIVNKEDRAPHRLTLGEQSDINDDLEYYADHRDKTEKLIYES